MEEVDLFNDYVKPKIVKIDVDGVIRDMLGALCKLYFEIEPCIEREHIRSYSVNLSFTLLRYSIG